MEEKFDRKWFNYFSNMRNKYNLRISPNKPLILFLDAKDSSKNKRELLKENEDGFFCCLDKTAQYFSKRYNCIVLYGTDEISLIIEDVKNFITSINNENSFRTHDVVSIFSQYFFEYFNNLYSKGIVYWHCKAFNINKEKIVSYVKFKSKGILKGITSLFLKKNGVKNAYSIKLEEKIKMCEEIKTFSTTKEYRNGVLYKNGYKISLNEFLKGNVQIIENDDDAKKESNFFDLIEFDQSL